MSEPTFVTPPPQSPQPIPYASAQPPRPGIITALGICSIIFGSLGALASLCGGLSAVANLTISRFSPTITTVATGTTITTTGTSSTATSYTFSTTAPAAMPATMPAIPPVAFRPFQISIGAASLSLIGEALSLAIAIYLICAGAAVMRNRLKAQPMHWRYVWIKAGVVVIATVGTSWMQYDLLKSFAAMPSAGPSPFSGAYATWAALLQAGFSAVFSLAYPVALIITLSTRQVKAYFAGLQ